ncbi:MAG TPA: outer membrane lipoprotein carrier protein LolA [Bacteroidia bacterium]|nr:outer membrane lipoprotein carrier protein LolA [Bacteroidia bacterium]
MKFLSTLLVIAGTSLFVHPCFSQAQKDPKAQEILKGVSAKYKSMKSLSASFKVVSVDQKAKTTDTQTGSIVVKGEKYKLLLKGQEVISDGKTSWTYLKESNEVQINEVAAKSDAISPTNIFTIYEKGFSSKYIGDKKINNVMVQQIELVPDDTKKSFFKIQININKADKVITSAKIFDKNGTNMTYTIEKFTANPDAPDSQFTFDKAKYPGVEVVDLR